MTTADGIKWFKQQFSTKIEAALAGRPYGIDLIVAVACQETGFIWQTLRKTHTVDQILTLCVGDTLDDTAGRKAFPKNKAELVAHAQGTAMFNVARAAIVAMAKVIPGYDFVNTKPNKFAHSFGMFQRDIQFFKVDPNYFLNQDYVVFENTLDHCLQELDRGVKKLGYDNKTTLSDLECAYVAIAYNTGGFKASKGLKQGYFDGKKYYGENLYSYILLSKTVAVEGTPEMDEPANGEAIIIPPETLTATGPFLRVDTMISTLRLRKEPLISVPTNANVTAELPDGQLVRSFAEPAVNGFLRVETSINGARLTGYASQSYLVPDAGATDIPVVKPKPQPAAGEIPAVNMEHKAGSITKRTEIAGAHSLNEATQPSRTGTNAAELTASLGDIIDWLYVDNPAHARYQPAGGKTFCNIYVHDYCHLAGAYIPRVWWTQSAIVKLAQGTAVKPKYEDTITEMRANNIFRWLRDFGNSFGWQQAATLDEVQLHANQGGLGLIVARRKDDGKPGHIVMVVPETAHFSAKRDSKGHVVAPLQSQAGASNFRYGNGNTGWWTGSQFAEFAFWKHA